jgi:hypothetical protein
MIELDGLAQLAEELRLRGINASHEIMFSAGCYCEGIEIDDEFFPLWELSLPDNQKLVDSFDFAAIKARRAKDWSVAPPLR